MTAGNPMQEGFDLWRKTLEEGTQAWMRAMGQATPPAAPAGAAPPFDFAQFWRPVLGQGMDLWQRAASQGGLTPEFMQQWKAFLDQAIETWSRALGQAMSSEAFAQALGKHLDQMLAVQAPLRKGLDQYTDAALRTLGFPSRGQVVSLASQVVGLEERLEGLEDRLDEIKGLLRGVLEAAGRRDAAAPAQPSSRTAPRGSRAPAPKET